MAEYNQTIVVGSTICHDLCDQATLVSPPYSFISFLFCFILFYFIYVLFCFCFVLSCFFLFFFCFYFIIYFFDFRRNVNSFLLMRTCLTCIHHVVCPLHEG